MKIIWSDRSVDRLRAIHDYIAAESSSAAARVIERIFTATEQLRAFPNSGRFVPEYELHDVREIPVNPYRILYRSAGGRIEIVNILHSRQLL
ncbi:MAG TPA: type II toxin-antitoxin system RelE/ParE family toxin [Candidatus Kapabacteria bacterium]